MFEQLEKNKPNIVEIETKLGVETCKNLEQLMVINSCYDKTKSQINSHLEFDINESENTAKVKFNL